MRIGCDFSPSSKDYFQQEYVFRFLASRNGWFSASTPECADILFKTAGRTNETAQPTGPDKFIFFLSDTEIQRVYRFLSCDDNVSPDLEPPPNPHPVVDEISHKIHQQLIQHAQRFDLPLLFKLPWPSGLPCAFCITHDVDLVRPYGVGSALSNLLSWNTDQLRGMAKQMVSKKNIVDRAFDELIEFYRQAKLKSTFFFIPRVRENLSYRYNIAFPKYKKLLRKIQSEGHEIGLHSSRYAFNRPRRYHSERERLARVSGVQIEGVRQHYLRLKFPEAWRIFEKEGFRYDASCGYNHAPGFRAGTSFPFFTADSDSEHFHSLYEFPFTLMDYAWKLAEDSENTGRSVFLENWKKVESFKGLFHVLWHPSNLADSAFRPLWKVLVEWADYHQFYNDSLNEIREWLNRKDRVKLLYFERSRSRLSFHLESPVAVRHLTLELIWHQQLNCENQLINMQRISKNCYRLVIDLMKPGPFHVVLDVS
jgi:hypothetical protein